MIGNTTDTFKYDTYGRMIEHTGDGFIIFGYNGRDGVVTDKNGLIYMRARYYSPEMRRFVNADIVPGEISNAITLNRYAYANGNPVSFVDPFGLEGFLSSLWDKAKETYNSVKNWVNDEIVQPAIKVVKNIAKDIENFDWNNSDEQKALESNYFSAYKGQFIIREDWGFTEGRSASFFVMFLNSNETDINTVKHEYGHFKQLHLLGLRRYIKYVAIPSVNSGDVPYAEYYSLPFEKSADILGNVERSGYNYTDGGKGSTFIIDTYIKDLNDIVNSLTNPIINPMANLMKVQLKTLNIESGINANIKSCLGSTNYIEDTNRAK